jgi:hypothetical protein
MLSPHEFATLMVVKATPDHTDLDRTELDALLARRLVWLERLASGDHRPRITSSGDLFLKTISRIRLRAVTDTVSPRGLVTTDLSRKPL